MEAKKQYFKVGSQIFILIVATIAFSYFTHENFSGLDSSLSSKNRSSVFGSFLFLLKIVNKLIWNEKTIVSAQSTPIYTCMKTNDGRVCAEYAYDQCDSNCKESCIPSRSKDITGCKIGTCYNSVEGTCAVGAIKKSCEDGAGVWIDDPNGNTLQCKKGCCIIGEESRFSTAGECTRASQVLGIEKNFKPEINTELACLLGSGTEKEGACLLGKDTLTQKNLCKFTTKGSCSTLKGEFYSEILCSHPDLGTNCVKQKTTSCIQGKSEIYWFDSCGNKENIYSADNVKSWNGGRVLIKDESCSLGSGSNFLANQGTCGNCNYYAGSTCGVKSGTEKLDDSSQEVVCKDLSCDEDGDGVKERRHGESWCAYQGAIGVDENYGRATDPPGSRYFRKVCAYGEVRTEPCADYRNEVCVEDQITNNNIAFSMSACRINRWPMCFSYNTISNKDEALSKCASNGDCFVKRVSVTENFDFSVCAPKYNPGFDLVNNGQAAGAACGLASQMCQKIWVKKLVTTGGSTKIIWRCEANCDCDTELFSEQMNNLCMSLGDCGAEVNYDGKLTIGGARINGAAPLSSGYLNEISRYSEGIPGKRIHGESLESIFNVLGLPNQLGIGQDPVDLTEEGFLAQLGEISGVAGGLLVTLLTLFGGFGAAGVGAAGVTGTFFPFLAGGGVGAGVPTSAGSGLTGTIGTVGAAIVGVAIGAVVGFAATYYLIQASGIAPGISQELLYTLLVAGTVGGAFLGLAAAGTSGAAVIGGVGWIPIVGWIIVAVVVIFIGILAAEGVGKVRKREIYFTCSPWYQPAGGENCNRCGKDGFPCSKYACQSLGSTCRFVNEGTKDETCVAVGINDVSPPVISPLEGGLSPGYVYSDANDLGVKIESTDDDGCVGTFTQINFGIALDKAGRCRYSSAPLESRSSAGTTNIGGDIDLTDEELAGQLTENFESDFSAGIIKENHTTALTLPSAESLGLPEYDPSRRTDFNIYIRCENANGYESERDYAVNFCVKPGKDLTAPIITIAEPSKGFAKYGATEQNLRVFTNEPANCSWSLTEKDYASMENSMSCENDIGAQTLFGWGCKSTLPVTKEETKYYIKCEDKPWESNASLRNRNAESKILNLKRTSELKITSAKPDNETLTFATPVSSIFIEARTSGGMSTGAACTLAFDGVNYLVNLEPSLGGTKHNLVLQSFTSGSKKIWLKCTDEIGNEAFKTASFKVQMDNTAPSITRVYYDGGRVFVKTNEPARCALSQEKCNFVFENGTLMEGTELLHDATPEINKRYYVKCIDNYNNSKGSCDEEIKVVSSITQEL